MNNETILVVEDNDSLREGICEMLNLEGYRVIEAADGKEAIALLQHHTPELILSDVMMPEMDGFDLYSVVRARRDMVSVPFIFLTARTDPADHLIGRKLGADDYLAKPVTRDELISVIRSRLNRYSQVRIAQLQQAYQTSLTILAGAIEARGAVVQGHIARMTEMALWLAEELGWNERAINQLRFGTILHDIGKLHVPDETLLKPGPLNEVEWGLIRQHPVVGAEMVRGIPFLSETSPIIRYHHEAWDGSGYPDGLSELTIPAGARILAVVDSFDAMVSERVYAPLFTLEEAYEEILRLSRARYDPEVVAAFTKAWQRGKIQQIYSQSVSAP